jgi:hypothetical protein
MKNILCLILFVLGFQVNAQAKLSLDTTNVYIAKYNKVDTSLILEDVLLKDLLKSPNIYKEKYVRIFGFLDLDLPNSAIYISEKDFEQKNITNRILFVLHKEDTYTLSQKINKEFGFVTGIFHLIEEDKFVGGLFRIQRVDKIKKELKSK